MKETIDSVDRLRGYKQALIDNGLPIMINLLKKQILSIKVDIMRRWKC